MSCGQEIDHPDIFHQDLCAGFRRVRNELDWVYVHRPDKITINRLYQHFVREFPDEASFRRALNCATNGSFTDTCTTLVVRTEKLDLTRYVSTDEFVARVGCKVFASRFNRSK